MPDQPGIKPGPVRRRPGLSKCMGIDPNTATEDQWMPAVDKIKERRR